MIGILLIALGLYIGGIYMSYEAVKAGPGGFLGLHYLLLDCLANTLLRLLELLCGRKSGVDHGLLHKFQRIARRTSKGNLLTVTVRGTGVGHGVAVVPVRHHFNIHGSVPSRGKFTHKLHTLLNGKDIHTINANTGDVITHLIVVRVRRVAIDGGAHTVLVVLNTEDHWKFPQTGHVSALPDLSLIGGTVTVAANGDVHWLTWLDGVLVGECQSSAQGDLRTDNAGTSPKVSRLVVEMHGTALGLGHAAR
mmetsp:Transcript_12392/g.26782  ORF Transcript_12392/g.26782 Transcript_12392/m.26782 type:complete len:250 (-) Transcript_12392:157-906(-)